MRLPVLFLWGLLLWGSAAAWAQGGVILHEEFSVSNRDVTLPFKRPAENLLDSMDVYALSPHAVKLRLPRMVTPELAARIRGGRSDVPPKEEWQRIIAKAARTHGLEPALIAAVIRAESDFDPNAVSDKGAQGAMQLMPGTQAELGVIDPYDPEANVLAGCAYLKAQLDRFKDLPLALAAYNAGPGSVVKYGGIPPYRETQAYVRRILQDLGESR